MSRALLPMCEDCDERPRAPRSRRCDPCREQRKAAHKASWQREHRDARRADARPVSIPRAEGSAAAQAALEALTALAPVRTRIAQRAEASREARDAVIALDLVADTLTRLRDMLLPGPASTAGR